MRKIIVLFVEGATDKEFYKLLIQYYRDSIPKTPDIKIFNLQGIGRFEGKVPSKLKHAILDNDKYKDIELKNIIVFCCYDTDVFELGKKPPTNWKKIRAKVKELGIDSFFTIKAEKMIEDWFLEDIDGICRFLKIRRPSKVKGVSGVDKMNFLFKRGKRPRIYQKGSYTHDFLSSLDITVIKNALPGVFAKLEKEIGYR